jgi:23S rRNA (guanine2445-N2)-methyltransferase / 23S rRNA (guanine2069-N7)-methyltransferase
VRSARENATRAGVEPWLSFHSASLAEAVPLPERATGRPGLLCTNPPYGMRMEDHAGAREVHRELVAVLREHFQGWSAAVLTGAPELGKELGLRAYRTHTVWNSGIECRLLRIRWMSTARARWVCSAAATRI